MKHSTLFIFIYLVAFTVFFTPAYCQNSPMDSLESALKNAKHDTDKLRILVQLSATPEMNNVLKYAQPAVELADKLLGDKPDKSLRSILADRKATAITNIGLMYEEEGNILKAFDHYIWSSKVQEEAGNQKGLASSLNDIGFIFEHQGDIPKALDYYGRSLKIREETGDKIGIAQSINNIGFIYKSQGDLVNALAYYSRSLKLYEETQLHNGQGLDKTGIGRVLNNIGHIYQDMRDYPKALACYNRGLQLYEETGYKEGIATLLGNIGIVYRNQDSLTRALDYFSRSLAIYKKIGQKKGMGIELNGIAATYLKQKKYALSIAYSDSALALAKELSFPSSILTAEKLRAKIDSALGNFSEAFEHYKQFIIYRDSLNNEDTRRASVKNQLKYEYDKKEAVMKETQEKERAVAEGKSRSQQIVIGSVAGGLLLVIIFAAFVYRSLKTTKKQKLIIEEKQREILDSIHYAKRIQTALLTNEKYIRKNLTRMRSAGLTQ